MIARGLLSRIQARQPAKKEMTVADRPEFISQVDPESFKLKGAYNQELESRALAQGPSAQAQSQIAAQQLEQSGAMDQAAKQAAGSAAGARRSMLMRGGQSGGAAERMGQQQQLNTLLAGQGIAGQGAKQRAGIMSADEAQKTSLLGGLADRSSQQVQALNQAKQDVFAKQMEVQSANKQAAAQAKAGSKCFLAGTKILMMNGILKNIEQIKVGDKCMHGGKVYDVITSDFFESIIYEYKGVIVTGSHAVREGGKFIRVEDSKVARRLPLKDMVAVYNLANEHHLIMADNGIVFGDYDETDDNTLEWDESLVNLTKSFDEISGAFC